MALNDDAYHEMHIMLAIILELFKKKSARVVAKRFLVAQR
jgi:hypothetical protein